MNALQQKCRPKHQVLVLKCYPRTTKGAVDVKPNSSELSYLLYYATSRRSKIHKIGAFLEKKTASDVWRMRIGNVQVTLGILAALVEKSPKDAVLIAPCILKILDLILRSNDITMIESSLPTWQAFCEHHDASSLFADQAYLNQYESVVRSYARLASTHYMPVKGPASRPMQVRWRNAGLGAIKCIAVSDALASPSGRQIDTIVPLILDNVWTDDDGFLELLRQRVEMEEKEDTEKLMLRRRTSVATVRTADLEGDANPLAISGTAMDVDKMAEEDTMVLAMQCLKSIFVVPTRSQIYTATTALLKFISERVAHGEKVVVRDDKGEHAGWAIKIYGIIAQWAPVQDRYVILVSALDTLMHTSMRDDSLAQHMALTAMIESLLRSDINLIGLSVMDVLLGLIKQIRKLFQLSSGSPAMTPNDEKTDSDKESDVRYRRKELLTRLERCIGDLASHVYYADQISDMIAAILGRLKPSGTASTPPRGDRSDGNESAGPAMSVLDLTDSQTLHHADAYFAYNAGRISALKVVKGILEVANPKSRTGTNQDLGRNRVPASVWEGSQWLLRDPDGHIRKAYADAVMTWLDLETARADLIARDDAVDFAPSKGSRENGRRAVSSASNRERQVMARRSQFLPQLHLAIYDSALQFVDYDNDLTMLHSLLTKLVFKLGVNAVRYGMPMIYRLQEEVMEVEQPMHKVRVAALCHGYFWALTEKFEFETSAVGRAINNEIIRRRSKGFWVEGIQIPAPPIDQIGLPGQVRPQPRWDLSALEREALLPFDDRSSLVQCVASGYEERAFSPPGSPTLSPGRAHSHSGPVLGASMMGGSISAAAAVAPDRRAELSMACREQMMVEWSREEVMAALAAEGKTESINGSRAGTIATNLRGLTISAAGMNGNGHHLPISSLGGSQQNLRPHSSQAFGEREHVMAAAAAAKYGQASIRSGVSPATHSASSRIGVPSVEQLKRILSGTAGAPQTSGFGGGSEDDSAESMVSYYSGSEKSLTDPDRPSTSGGPLKRSVSGSPGGSPPMPALPHSSGSGGGVSIHDYAFKGSRRLVSRGGESVGQRREEGKGVDLQELLRGIESHPGEGSLGNLTKPPY